MLQNKDDFENELDLKIKTNSKMKKTSEIKMTEWVKLPFNKFSHTALEFSGLLYFFMASLINADDV